MKDFLKGIGGEEKGRSGDIGRPGPDPWMLRSTLVLDSIQHPVMHGVLSF